MVRDQEKQMWRWLYRRLADYPLGREEMERPPGTAAALDFGRSDDDGRPMYVARCLNDGYELWIGFRSAWLFHCRAEDARRLAWFILWDWWVLGTWFGLRRRLWYRALHHVLRDSHRHGSPPSATPPASVSR